MTEYRLSPAAEYDLEDIWLYTWRKWGVQQANRYIDMIYFEQYAQLPRPAFPGPSNASVLWS